MNRKRHSNYLLSIKQAPVDLQIPFDTIFSKDALDFLADLFLTFDKKIDQLYYDRLTRKAQYNDKTKRPTFSESPARSDKTWRVAPVPKRLENRRLDLGDVSPSNKEHFVASLRANVQGIQVDFDDGHCPTWRNQIIGLYNVFKAVYGLFDGIPSIDKLPVLMLRPRAWNMIEHNIMVNGKEIPGSLVDFAMLIYHNGASLNKSGSGPFFYLSKLEGAREAALWNEIFIWAQEKLDIPRGTIKACVLIENILSTFEMEEILYELREHSLGLNCGIWDYAASIICKFGDRKEFVLPDRNKYVNMERHFLKRYMDLVIRTCHNRGAHATGGMSALLTTNRDDKNGIIIRKVVEGKKIEILAGVDGFMVYDLKLVPHMNKLWDDLCGTNQNQLHKSPTSFPIAEEDLLKMPVGGVTFAGLKHNVEVGILFIYNWFKYGKGHFTYKNAVEDSATAEISRSQIWQWIRHNARIEETRFKVSKVMIKIYIAEYLDNENGRNDDLLLLSARLFLQLVTAREFPEFITTFLNDSFVFRAHHERSTDHFVVFIRNKL